LICAFKLVCAVASQLFCVEVQQYVVVKQAFFHHVSKKLAFQAYILFTPSQSLPDAHLRGQLCCCVS